MYQTGSANNELILSTFPSPPPHDQQPDRVERRVTPPNHPLLLNEDEELLVQPLDDDRRVPVGHGAVRRARGCSPTARHRVLSCNGAIDTDLSKIRNMPVDTDEDDIGNDQQSPRPLIAQKRRVSWDDEVRVYPDNESQVATMAPVDAVEEISRTLPEGSILLNCDRLGCPKTALPNSTDGKDFKQCHNCETTFCSRQCRREAWELHRITCDAIRVQNIIKLAINCIRRLPKVMDTLSEEARRGYISRGHGTVKMYFDSVRKAEDLLRHGAEALGKFDYIAWTALMPGELEASLYVAMVELCRNYNPENRFILYIVVCVEAEIHPSKSGMPRIERKVVGNFVKLRLTGESLAESQPLMGSPHRRFRSTLPQPLTLIMKATPLPKYLDRVRVFDKIKNILCSRGISLRRQEPKHYAALQHYVAEGGTPCIEPIKTNLRYDSITIYARVSKPGQPDIYIVMVDVNDDSVDAVLRTSNLRVVVFDLINETDAQLQMILGMAEAVEVVQRNSPIQTGDSVTPIEPSMVTAEEEEEARIPKVLNSDMVNIGDVADISVYMDINNSVWVGPREEATRIDELGRERDGVNNNSAAPDPV